MAQLSVMPIRLALDLIEHIWRCAFAPSGLRMNAVHDIHAREPIANRLLLSLPPETLARLRPELEIVALQRGQTIDRVDGKIENLHFVNRGLVSLVKTMRDGRSVEIGAVGIEGVTDPSTLFGVETAIVETIVQVPGTAFRIPHESLLRAMTEDPDFRCAMKKYVRFAISEIAQTAACNRLHTLEERCCRWLLIARDSALSDTFPLTHEFLAMMLGVQRAGVSVAAGALQKAELIRYVRGSVTIVDHAGLEEVSCECYASLRAELDLLFTGPSRAVEIRPPSAAF